MEAILNTKDNTTPYIKWSAVMAGVIASMASSVLLNFLGIGIGLTAFNMDANSLINTGIGSVIWLALAGIISMSIGGYIAGHFTNSNSRALNGYHGILAWCLATLITIAAATTGLGAMMGGASSIISNSAKVMAQNPNLATQSKNMVQNAMPNTSTENTDQNDVKDAAETASKTIGQVSISIVIAFLLSAIASLLTSMAATRKN